MKRFAAIDAGTNTILMVIGESDGSEIKILRDEHSIARLGEGVDSSGIITPEAAGRAMAILRKYAEICKSLKVDKVRLCGTSALRDAANRLEIIEQLKNAVGEEIEIISGEEEARLSYIGSIEGKPDESGLVIDIGGGSTEFISGQGENYISRISLPIGAVRLTERFFNSDPPLPEEIRQLKLEIKNFINQVNLDDYRYRKLYAVAGTPTTLAAIALGLKEFKREDIQGYILHIDTIRSVSEKLIKTPVSEIIKDYGIHPKRADVVNAGIMILLESMDYLRAETCFVSVKGLRYGILIDMFNFAS